MSKNEGYLFGQHPLVEKSPTASDPYLLVHKYRHDHGLNEKIALFGLWMSEPLVIFDKTIRS